MLRKDAIAPRNEHETNIGTSIIQSSGASLTAITRPASRTRIPLSLVSHQFSPHQLEACDAITLTKRSEISYSPPIAFRLAPFCIFLGWKQEGWWPSMIRLPDCGLRRVTTSTGHFLLLLKRCKYRSIPPDSMIVQLSMKTLQTIIDKMPKNWSKYEDDIRRLYMEEGNPLKEVRRIMFDDHGFLASCELHFLELGS